ncbi:hypothetical protein LZ32DRAFT_128882 [Colletotrichum eremochloae]|nr:hypothetical protein LZ32DRAFT_128882 [Colletotrichum eremochloae]
MIADSCLSNCFGNLEMLQIPLERPFPAMIRTLDYLVCSLIFAHPTIAMHKQLSVSRLPNRDQAGRQGGNIFGPDMKKHGHCPDRRVCLAFCMSVCLSIYYLSAYLFPRSLQTSPVPLFVLRSYQLSSVWKINSSTALRKSSPPSPGWGALGGGRARARCVKRRRGANMRVILVARPPR